MAGNAQECLDNVTATPSLHRKESLESTSSYGSNTTPAGYKDGPFARQEAIQYEKEHEAAKRYLSSSDRRGDEMQGPVECKEVATTYVCGHGETRTVREVACHRCRSCQQNCTPIHLEVDARYPCQQCWQAQQRGSVLVLKKHWQRLHRRVQAEGEQRRTASTSSKNGVTSREGDLTRQE